MPYRPWYVAISFIFIFHALWKRFIRVIHSDFIGHAIYFWFTQTNRVISLRLRLLWSFCIFLIHSNKSSHLLETQTSLVILYISDSIKQIESLAWDSDFSGHSVYFWFNQTNRVICLRLRLLWSFCIFLIQSNKSSHLLETQTSLVILYISDSIKQIESFAWDSDFSGHSVYFWFNQTNRVICLRLRLLWSFCIFLIQSNKSSHLLETQTSLVILYISDSLKQIESFAWDSDFTGHSVYFWFTKKNRLKWVISLKLLYLSFTKKNWLVRLIYSRHAIYLWFTKMKQLIRESDITVLYLFIFSLTRTQDLDFTCHALYSWFTKTKCFIGVICSRIIHDNTLKTLCFIHKRFIQK